MAQKMNMSDVNEATKTVTWLRRTGGGTLALRRLLARRSCGPALCSTCSNGSRKALVAPWRNSVQQHRQQIYVWRGRGDRAAGRVLLVYSAAVCRYLRRLAARCRAGRHSGVNSIVGIAAAWATAQRAADG